MIYDFPDYFYIFSTILFGIAGFCVGFFHFKNIRASFTICILGVALSLLIQNLLFLGEIDYEEYNKIYLSIKDRPELISVLPNYTDKNCLINKTHYSSLMLLINSKDIKTELGEIPHKYNIEYVKSTCKKTVFNEKNLAEIHD